jgi:hypothetical protein
VKHATEGSARRIVLAAGVLLLATSTLVGGCANTQPFSAGFAGPAQASDSEPDAGKKTLASKVLTAIALERITGRKPDPSRLNELN